MIKNNEDGRTMIESIMVISIIIMISLGAAKIAASVHDKYKMSKIGTQITTLSKVITQRFSTVGKYRVDDSDDGTGIQKKLLSEQLIPSDMARSGGAIYHAYHGPVVIKGNNRNFTITFMSLSKPVCIELGVINWTLEDNTRLISININTDTYTWADNIANNDKYLPITVTGAGNSCLDGEVNSITWKFE